MRRPTSRTVGRKAASLRRGVRELENHLNMSAVTGTCKLCRRAGVELQDSHFIPAAAYRAIQKSTNTAPVVVRNETAIQRNEQTRDYVLCRDCEQRFTRGGEDWVMDYCNRPGKGFRLKEIIDGMQPVGKGATTLFYSAAAPSRRLSANSRLASECAQAQTKPL